MDLNFAHRALCAAAIRWRAAADSRRRPPRLLFFPAPPTTPLRASIARSNFVRSAFNCASTAPRSVIQPIFLELDLDTTCHHIRPQLSRLCRLRRRKNEKSSDETGVTPATAVNFRAIIAVLWWMLADHHAGVVISNTQERPLIASVGLLPSPACRLGMAANGGTAASTSATSVSQKDACTEDIELQSTSCEHPGRGSSWNGPLNVTATHDRCTCAL